MNLNVWILLVALGYLLLQYLYHYLFTPLLFHHVRVIDGDTFVWTQRGLQERIRLLYIDAPELSQFYGPEAKDVLEIILLTCDAISCPLVCDRKTYSDVYGRTLASCKIADMDISGMMVGSGAAIPYRVPVGSHSFYDGLLQTAKRDKAGMWIRPPETVMDPAVYRATQKEFKRDEKRKTNKRSLYV